MTWTYNGSPWTTTDAVGLRDSVRFLLDDTDSANPQLQDGEIAGLLAHNASDPYKAAIEATLTLEARYVRRANKTTADLSLSYRGIASDYASLRKALTSQMARHDAPLPYLGGMSRADMDIDRENDDLNGPNFVVGGMDDTGSSDLGTGGTGFTQIVPG